VLRRSEVEILFQSWGEITDFGNDAQFMVFMRYRATEDYVDQLFFCRPLAKYATKNVLRM